MKLCMAVSLAVGLALAALPGAARAQESADKPFLSSMFTDNMVLQRDKPILVWGWTAPGAKVTVQMEDARAQAKAGADGRWLARLPSHKAGGPYTVTVSGPQAAQSPQVTPGTSAVTLRNVLVGDVWFCSGQSNMEMGIQAVNDAEKEVVQANDAQLRLYTVRRNVAGEPATDPHGEWLVCTPENIQKGVWAGFSSVAYFFGRELRRTEGVPIGLIHSSWGGTRIEAWTSPEGLRRMPGLAAEVDGLQKAVLAQRGGKSLEEQQAAWWRANDPGSASSPGWESPALDTAGWKTMTAPAAWEDAGLPNYDGVVWFRKTVNLPDTAAGKEAVLSLGPVDDHDVTFVNGVMVGSGNDWTTARRYAVPAGVVKPGSNVIAVRVLDTAGAGGLTGTPDQMRIEIAGEAPVSLAGPWQYRPTVDLSKGAPYPQPLDNPNLANVLFNGMVAPVAPYAIKGAIWYQGEGNAGNAYQYRSLMPNMIADWRRHFPVGDFPFFIVQLANFTPRLAQPGESDWAELREAQAMTVQHDKNTGLAVAIDIGDANDIHPKNKQEVGRRLALAARRVAYGEDVVDSGPTYKGMTIEGSSIRLTFDNVSGGLAARDGNLQGFAVAGEDRKFTWADARIDGDTVVVSALGIEKPVAVRYAWANNPDATLYNGAGLPAVPFRTDTWPGLTQPK